MMEEIEFIIYVADQQKSRDFYKNLFNIEPTLDVPGMTEFNLTSNCKLGIMPESGIAKILGDKTLHPSKGSGIPRCELYLKVENAPNYFNRGLVLGGAAISPIQKRDWGDTVGYLADIDGHIIAIVEK
jgi:uncharacterized glyoxalase superfamily protein PhnB